MKKLTNGEVALTISAKACLPHEKIMRSLAYDGCGLVSAREVDAGGGDEHQFLHQGSVVIPIANEKLGNNLVFTIAQNNGITQL